MSRKRKRKQVRRQAHPVQGFPLSKQVRKADSDKSLSSTEFREAGGADHLHPLVRAEISSVDPKTEEGQNKYLTILQRHLETDTSAETAGLLQRIEQIRQQDPFPVIGMIVGNSGLHIYTRQEWLGNEEFMKECAEQGVSFEFLRHDKYPSGTVFFFIWCNDMMKWRTTVMRPGARPEHN